MSDKERLLNDLLSAIESFQRVVDSIVNECGYRTTETTHGHNESHDLKTTSSDTKYTVRD